MINTSDAFSIVKMLTKSEHERDLNLTDLAAAFFEFVLQFAMQRLVAHKGRTRSVYGKSRSNLEG